MIEKVIVLDIDKLPPLVKEGIENGIYKIFNGVVRDGGGNIVKHIPQKIIELSPKDLQNLPSFLQGAQGTALAATALSTTVILGAIVVATTVIVNKLSEIQSSIDDIKKELQDQNLFQYFLQLKDYVAVSESLREILTSPECVDENRDLIALKLNEISIKRNGLMLTMNERLSNIDNVSAEHKEVVVNFLDQSVALLPKIAYLESEGAGAIGKFKLSEKVNAEFSNKYQLIEFRYKRFLNNEIDRSIRGESILASRVIENIRKSAELEFETNQYLLANPSISK